jgi:subtilisin family serine protease
LKKLGAEAHPELTRGFEQYGIPLSAFTVTSVPVPRAVAQLLAIPTDGGPAPRVAPNHVFVGEPHYMGSPASEPRPATAAVEPDPGEVERDGLTIAALDTGIPTNLNGLHPSLSARMLTEDPDIDVLFTTGDLLDHEAGHGTFVSGILMQLAPWVTIDPEKVLDSAGFGDDAQITFGLARSNRTLVNASFGGYTHGDRPPLALETFLSNRDPESVIVAAAGNNNSDRPFWPAAFKHVIAVGAVDTTNGTLARASFSNFGEWVDCCAPGVEIKSTYVNGEWRLDQPGESGVEHLNGWACWSGTSFAAPHVAAAIAAQMKGTNLTPRQAAHAVLAGSTTYVAGVAFYIEPEHDLVCRDC